MAACGGNELRQLATCSAKSGAFISLGGMITLMRVVGNFFSRVGRSFVSRARIRRPIWTVSLDCVYKATKDQTKNNGISFNAEQSTVGIEKG